MEQGKKTRLVVLPDERTAFFLDLALSIRETLGIALSGEWRALMTVSLAEPPGGWQVIRVGRLVIVAGDWGSEHAFQKPLGSSLTERKLAVLRCLAEGLSTKEISLKLNMQERTVYLHISQLKARFAAATRAQLVLNFDETDQPHKSREG
jgi:DNA-binding CsgD family transcriptional regulator